MNGIICIEASQLVKDLKRDFLAELGLLNQYHDFYVTENGRIADEHNEAKIGKVYRFHARLLGGKGGFGSMLRALGAQIEKTTNREACRDLSGRRMRDVNNEKKLKKWIEKAPEREQKKKEEEDEKKKGKKTVETKYFFDSKAYDEQKEKIKQDFEDAIKQGLKRPAKKEVKKEVDPSKAKDWFGFDLGSSDDDESDDETPKKKAKLENESEKSLVENNEKENSCEPENIPKIEGEVAASEKPFTESEDSGDHVNEEDPCCSKSCVESD